MTAIPVDDIAARARQIRFWRTLLTCITAVFFALGWSVAKLWLGVAFLATAVQLGFKDGMKPTRPQA